MRAQASSSYRAITPHPSAHCVRSHLGNLFALTVNGEEVYYKGSWPSISADYDQIIYIPDVFVSEIPVYRSARLDEYEWLKANLYTADDFLHFANTI